MPNDFEVNCAAPPSMFAYPKLEEKKEGESVRVRQSDSQSPVAMILMRLILKFATSSLYHVNTCPHTYWVIFTTFLLYSILYLYIYFIQL